MTEWEGWVNRADSTRPFIRDTEDKVKEAVRTHMLNVRRGDVYAQDPEGNCFVWHPTIREWEEL